MVACTETWRVDSEHGCVPLKYLAKVKQTTDVLIIMLQLMCLTARSRKNKVEPVTSYTRMHLHQLAVMNECFSQIAHKSSPSFIQSCRCSETMRKMWITT